MSGPIDLVLSKLEKVRQRQAGQWSASCPAHNDKSPSLSVRETDEGAVLLHCFSGCSPYEIVASLGLEMHNLYPPRERPANAPKRTAKLLTSSQALELLDEEMMVATILVCDACAGKAISPDDRDRYLKAAHQISWIREQCMGGSHDQF